MNIIAAFELFQSANIERNTEALCLTVIAAVLFAIVPIPNYSKILPYLFAAALLLFSFMMQKIGRIQIDTPIRIIGISILISFLFRSVIELRKLEEGFWYPGPIRQSPVLRCLYIFVLLRHRRLLAIE